MDSQLVRTFPEEPSILDDEPDEDGLCDDYSEDFKKLCDLHAGHNGDHVAWVGSVKYIWVPK